MNIFDLIGTDVPNLDATGHPVPPFDPSRMMSATPNNAGLATPPMQPIAPATLAQPAMPSYGAALGKLSMMDKLRMLGRYPVDTLKAAAGGLAHGLSQLPDKFGNGLLGEPNDPNGLVSPEERHQAAMQGLLHFGLSMLNDAGPTTGVAPSFGQSLARGLLAGEQAGKGAYNDFEQRTIAQLPMQMQMRMLKARQAIGQMYQAKPNETPQETAQRFIAMRDAYASVGDTDSVKEVDSLLKELPMFKGMDPMTVDAGDKTLILDKRTGKPVAAIPKGLSPEAVATNQYRDAALGMRGAEMNATNQLRAATINATQAQRQQTNINAIVDDFARDTKDYQKVKAGYDVLDAAIKNPNLAQPYALLDAYARVSNPGAIVRPSTMQILEDIGSVNQRVRKAIEKNLNGTLPPDIVRDLATMVQGMVRNHRATYNEQRAAALRRAKAAGIDNIDNFLPHYDVTLPGDNTPPPSASPFGALGHP